MASRFVFALTMTAALAAGHSALAFQEQKGSAAPATSEAAPAAVEAPGGDAKGALTEEGTAKPEGTEIRIPGLGKLGVLPKMDFGLELLYGAAENQPAGQPEPVPNPEDDLTVRGSVKHRF